VLEHARERFEAEDLTVLKYNDRLYHTIEQLEKLFSEIIGEAIALDVEMGDTDAARRRREHEWFPEHD